MSDLHPVYDCVVVGAGPAGGTAAYHLARLGHRTLLLDKTRLPRAKPCGGGVPPQVKRWLDFDLTPALSARVTRLRATWQMGEAVEGPLETREPLYMVRREVFDQLLVQKALDQGAALRDNLAWTALRPDPEGWTLELPDAPPLRARYLLAADGALGKTAQALGFPPLKHRVAGALEAEAPFPMAGTDTAHVDFGAVPGGYLWNFPKAEGWSLGGGLFRGSTRVALRTAVERYAASFGLDGASLQVAGHPLHLWDGHQTLHTHRALLAGEAACLVDPFTGIGILPAVMSGALAAEAIHRALGEGPDALSGYTRQIQREWGADMVWARRLARAFYGAPALTYRLAVQREGALRALGQLLCGEASYASLGKRFLSRLTGSRASLFWK